MINIIKSHQTESFVFLNSAGINSSFTCPQLVQQKIGIGTKPSTDCPVKNLLTFLKITASENVWFSHFSHVIGTVLSRKAIKKHQKDSNFKIWYFF